MYHTHIQSFWRNQRDILKNINEHRHTVCMYSIRLLTCQNANVYIRLGKSCNHVFAVGASCHENKVQHFQGTTNGDNSMTFWHPTNSIQKLPSSHIRFRLVKPTLDSNGYSCLLGSMCRVGIQPFLWKAPYWLVHRRLETTGSNWGEQPAAAFPLSLVS